jgi:outer membrane protein assembly factor BamC
VRASKLKNVPLKSIGVAFLLSLSVAACSTVAERNKVDYKSAGRLPPLEVPPDLAAPKADDRFSVPEGGVATYSNFSQDRGSRDQTAAKLLPEQERMHVERAGAQRWLVVGVEPEALWDPIREFWQDSGFLIGRELPEAGLMETDWAENRAKIPQSSLRKLVGLALDNVYSYPERDKFRTRIERGQEPGTSEIFVTHRGMYEVITSEGRGRDNTMWQARPSDPELEAEMLYRLMARLGAKENQVQTARQSAPPPPRAELSKAGDTVSGLHLVDTFDRAWRRVGLALDRVGFTVEDRDRSRGLYYVRYADPDAETKESALAKLVFWRDKGVPKDAQYQISVQETDPGSEVRILNASGELEQSPTASRILALLQEELR